MAASQAGTRRLGIAISIALLAYSAGSLLAEIWAGGDLNANPPLCRFLPCGGRLPELARQGLWNSDPAVSSAALPAFQEALRRDPASPFPWCDLGEAYAQAGLLGQARYCFQKAVEHAPQTPAILLRAANFHFAAGDQATALKLSARCLAIFRDYDRVIFSQYTRMGVPLLAILHKGLPPKRDAARSFFRYLLARESLPELAASWDWLAARNFTGQDLLSGYLTLLLQERRYGQAVSLQRHFLGTPATQEESKNLLFNPGFEREPAGTPLDWTIHAVNHAVARRDPETSREGLWSLRIDFDGEANLDYRHVSEKVVAEGGRHLFRAWLRTENLTTDQGVRFHIFDVENRKKLDLTTDQITGTAEWTEIERRFTVPRGARLLEIQIRRTPSWKFDNKLAGTVWIDDVSLTRR